MCLTERCDEVHFVDTSLVAHVEFAIFLERNSLNIDSTKTTTNCSFATHATKCKMTTNIVIVAAVAATATVAVVAAAAVRTG